MTLAAIKVYRLNNQITASPVRLISSDGKQIGVVPIEEARKMAEESNQDLVEISGEAQPPVIKLIDFKKFRYQEAKKEREAAKKVKKVDLKETEKTPEHFIEGRTAEIIFNKKRIGFIGEVHPRVLRNWKIKMPVALFEISLDDVLK